MTVLITTPEPRPLRLVGAGVLAIAAAWVVLVRHGDPRAVILFGTWAMFVLTPLIAFAVLRARWSPDLRDTRCTRVLGHLASSTAASAMTLLALAVGTEGGRGFRALIALGMVGYGSANLIRPFFRTSFSRRLSVVVIAAGVLMLAETVVS
jgi:hypothetical protein